MNAPSRQLQTLKAEFFRALAHPMRIRLLEVLVLAPERSVQDLQRTIGIDQPIVSQQLARLRASGIVVAKKSGTATRYSVTDPLLKDLLQIAIGELRRSFAVVGHVGVTRDAHELYRRVGFRDVAKPGNYMELVDRDIYTRGKPGA